MHHINETDIVKSDQYVYRNELKLRKNYLPRDGWGKGYWPGLLDQLERVELAYWKLKQRANKHYEKVSKSVRFIYREGHESDHSHHKRSKVVYANVLHDLENGVWAYYVDHSPLFGGLAYTCKWIEPESMECEVSETGQNFYNLTHKHRPLWYHPVKELLRECIVRYARKNLTPPKGIGWERPYLLHINGRPYWLHGIKKSKSFVKYNVATWPGDGTIVHTVGKRNRGRQHE